VVGAIEQLEGAISADREGVAVVEWLASVLDQYEHRFDSGSGDTADGGDGDDGEGNMYDDDDGGEEQEAEEEEILKRRLEQLAGQREALSAALAADTAKRSGRDDQQTQATTDQQSSVRCQAAANELKQAAGSLLCVISEIQGHSGGDGDGGVGEQALRSYFAQEEAVTDALRGWLQRELAETDEDLAEHARRCRKIEVLKRSFGASESERIEAEMRLAATEKGDGGKMEDGDDGDTEKTIHEELETRLKPLMEELSQLEIVPALIADCE
jgi:hypothetical protein